MDLVRNMAIQNQQKKLKDLILDHYSTIIPKLLALESQIELLAGSERKKCIQEINTFASNLQADHRVFLFL